MPADTPARIHTLFRDAFNARDVEAVIALYEPNAVFVAGGQALAGKQAIREAYENIFSRRAWMTLDTRSITHAEEEGLAVLHGVWKIEPLLSDAGGETSQGISTEVVRRQPDGSWLFVIDNPHSA